MSLFADAQFFRWYRGAHPYFGAGTRGWSDQVRPWRIV